MREQIGHYRIDRKIGEGGMGTVYAAQDERLGRPVAIKKLRQGSEGAEARKRLWREARTLAQVNHPGVCQIYDVLEEGDSLLLVMELLAGQSLANRLSGCPMTHAEAVAICIEILEALEALHQRGIVHRDLKPSNVFLTPHGVKLLDFGLAVGTREPGGTSPDLAETISALTDPGTVVGTPQYMAPEQIRGEAVGPAADLFAAGCVLYEMLSGRKAFEGGSNVDILYAVLHSEPPALDSAAGKVASRASRKKAGARYASAREMAEALRKIGTAEAIVTAPQARPATRLIALPFRTRKRGEEMDFLAYSLPDAISNSLSGIGSLVVRSTLVAERFGDQVFDAKKIGAEAEVDAILTGNLLQVGDRLQVSSQLVEASSGTLLWSDTALVTMRDLFQLQDALVDRIVQALMQPLTMREKSALKRDVPATASAYECYLRGNEACRKVGLESMRKARDFYLECVEMDPGYAPAWARLGRCYRYIEKSTGSGAEDFALAEAAFRRAFELNPDLSLAHNLYTQIESDLGRAQEAMVRLLHRVHLNRNDPNLLAGLVQSCRYSGQLEASVAAHERARSLDPHIITSAAFTYFLMGEYQKALDFYRHNVGFYLDAAAVACLGREAEALEMIRSRRNIERGGPDRSFLSSFERCLEGDRAGVLRAVEEFVFTGRKDPETFYLLGRHLARIGEAERAEDIFSKAIAEGYYCPAALLLDPWMEEFRATPAFERVLGRARKREEAAHAAFVAAGGERLLGPVRVNQAVQV